MSKIQAKVKRIWIRAAGKPAGQMITDPNQIQRWIKRFQEADFEFRPAFGAYCNRDPKVGTIMLFVDNNPATASQAIAAA